MLKFLKSRDFVVSVLSSLAVTALLTCGSWAWNYKEHQFGRCPDTVKSVVTDGEAELQSNHLTSAEHDAGVADIQAPKCPYVKEFSAAVTYAEFRALHAGTSIEVAKHMLMQCYDEAFNAKKVGDENSRNEATLRNCNDTDALEGRGFSAKKAAKANKHHAPSPSQKPSSDQPFLTSTPGPGS